MQNDVGKVMQKYHQTLTFYKNCHSIPTTSHQTNKSQVSGSSPERPTVEEKVQAGDIKELNLERIKSLEPLLEAREYWERRRTEAQAVYNRNKTKLTEDVERIRQEALDLETANNNTNIGFFPNVRTNDNYGERSNDHSEEQPAILETPSPLRKSPEVKGISLSPVLSQNITGKKQTQKTSVEQIRFKKTVNKRRFDDYNAVPGTLGTNQKLMLPVVATAESSADVGILQKTKNNAKILRSTRSLRFGDPTDALARIRNPKTGRFVTSVEDKVINTPKKKQNPEYLLKKPKTQNERYKAPIAPSSSSEESKDEEIAVITKQVQGDLYHSHDSRKSEERTWSRLRRSQRHLGENNFLRTRQSEELIYEPLTDERIDELIKRCETEPKLLASWTPAQGRVLLDMTTCLRRIRRAREKHNERDTLRGIRRDYGNDTTLFAASSEEDSSQVQSDIREAVEDYELAIQFYHDYYPTNPNPISSPTLIKSESQLLTSHNTGPQVNRRNNKMDDLNLDQVTSLEQLYEIKEYWVQRQTEAQAKIEHAKAEVIREIELIKQNTLNMEASLDQAHRQTKPTVIQPSCSLKESQRQLINLPVKQLDKNVRIYQSSDETRPTPSPQTPSLLQSDAKKQIHKAKEMTSTPQMMSNPPTPTYMAIMETQQLPLQPIDKLELLASSKEDIVMDNRQTHKITESQLTTTTEVKTPQNIYTSSSSNSTDSEEQVNQNKVQNEPKPSRQERFAKREEPLFRLRNPLTGRFVPKSRRRLSGPPGKRRRPNYVVEKLNPKPSTSQHNEENEDPQISHNISVTKNTVPRQLTASEFTDCMARKFMSLNPRPQVLDRLGPKIVAQKLLVGSERIIIRPKLEGEDRRMSL